MILVRVVGMIAGIVVARIAGPGVVGAVAYGTAYVGVFGFINGLFGSAHIKLVSEGQDEGKCMNVYSWLQGISALVYFLVVFGWFLIQKNVLDYPFESREIEIIIMISLFAHFAAIFEQYSSVVFTAKLQQAKANLPHFTKELLRHVGRIVIVVLGYRALTLTAWILVCAVLIIPMIVRLLKGVPWGKFDRDLLKRYIGYGVPTLLVVIIGSVTMYADKLILAHYTNTTQIGYYTAAFSIGGLLLLVSVPIGNIFFPLFSKYIASHDWDALNNKILAYQDVIVLFVFPAVCLLSILGGDLLILILGAKYEPSIKPFIILLFATYVTLYGMPYGNIISGMGKFYLDAGINLAKLVIFMISLTILISPRFLGMGALGLAINLLIINSTVNLLYLFFARKHGEVKINHMNLIRHGIIIAVSISVYFLSEAIKMTAVPKALLTAVFFLTLSYLPMYAFKLFNKQHIEVLLDAVNIKKTFGYINNELRRK